jgi:hypothetical protein
MTRYRLPEALGGGEVELVRRHEREPQFLSVHVPDGGPQFDIHENWLTAVDPMDLMTFWGDEDCGVSVQCERCSTGGAALAYYYLAPSPVPHLDGVPNFHRLAELIEFTRQHAETHREANS